MSNRDFNPTKVPYEGQDRRTPNPDDYVTHWQLEDRLEHGRELMITHFDERFDSLEKLIKSGFPNGDPHKHCEVHEGFIQDAADKAALWKSVREKTISGAIWAALLMLSSAVWEYLKVGVHK